MDENIMILIVDDDYETLDTLSMIFANKFSNYEVNTARDGEEALNSVKPDKPTIVLSDIFMPKMDGYELCRRFKVRKDLSELYVILFTGGDEGEQQVDALDSGADDFIRKPFSSEVLVARIRAAIRIIKSQIKSHKENLRLKEMAERLESDLDNMKKLAARFMHSRLPFAAPMIEKVADASVEMAKNFNEINEKKLKDIEFAASLCYAGRMFLPDDLLKIPVMSSGIVVNEIMKTVPVSAKDILSSVDRLQNAAIILYHLYENYDGTGCPDQLQAWQIPIGSRIIRSALDFFEFIYIQGMSQKEAFERIANERKRLYDHRAVAYLEQYIAAKPIDKGELQERLVKVYELEVGMTLARDITTRSGFKLVGDGKEITESVLKKIISHNSVDPILGDIVVKIQR